MFSCANIQDGEESTFLKDCKTAVASNGNLRDACVDGDENKKCLIKACCDYSNLYTSDSSITEVVV